MNSNQDLNFLRRAVDLSRESLNNGGFPAASLLVRDNQEISFGLSCTEVNQDITAHSDMQAIRAAGAHAFAPLTLYSTLEPCLMCLSASALAGVIKIVFSCRRTLVDKSYYINSIDALEAAQFLTNPPEFFVVDNFESEIISLIEQFEQKVKLSDSR